MRGISVSAGRLGGLKSLILSKPVPIMTAPDCGFAEGKHLALCLCLACLHPGTCFAAEQVKPAPAGLVSFGFPPKGWEAIFNVMVYKCKWGELEPGPGRYESGFQKIDETLKRADQKGLAVHLLIVCGEDSPAWLKDEVGTVTAYDTAGVAYNPRAAGGRTCARWWEPGFGRAYDRMQQALAARYDADPRLAAVGMNRCMSYWPEPFMRQLKERQNRQNLRQAGYSARLDKAAQSETLKTHAGCWRRTRSSIALDPYQALVDSGDRWASDMEYTATFIREATQVLGGRLILQNDSFVSERPHLGEEYWRMYDLMRGSGATFGLQPRGTTGETIGDLRTLIEAAIGQGASYLELVNIYQGSPISKEEFAALDRRLEANGR